MSYIQKLYKIERNAIKQNLVGEALVRERQEKAKPILDEFERWLTLRRDDVPPKSFLGEAVTYTSNQWSRLVPYVDHFHVTMDNNMVKNTIRPFVIGRKNWLFSGSPKGAAASAAIYSLIETAKVNKIEPYLYFRHLLEKLPDAMIVDDYRALLPQYLDKSHFDGPPLYYTK